MLELSEHKIYIYLAIIFGLLFVFITPPFQSPDEDSHFKKAYLTSKGVLYPTVKGEKCGNDLPTDMIDYIKEKLHYIGDRYKKYQYSEFVTDQYGTMNHEKKSFNVYSTAQVLFVAYIPAAIGIIASKFCAILFGMQNVSVPYMLYFARIFSLIVSIFIVYHAIKITPVLKKTMTAVALMPMSLYLMGMVTYDSIIISISLLTIAYLLRLIYDKKIKKITYKDILILIALGFMLLNYKMVYSTLFILLLFIPKEKFSSMKKKVLSFIIIGSSVLLLTIILKIPILLLPKVVEGSEELVNSQLHFVLNHIFRFLHILYRNIIDQRATQLTGMVGMFGLVDTFLPLPIVFFYLGFLLIIALIENSEDKYTITNWMKISLLFAISLTVLATFSAMYISWTPKIFGKIGTYDLTGVQGRYFIPVLFPALLIFTNKRIKGHYIDIIKKQYVIGILLTLIISEITILLRFWI